MDNQSDSLEKSSEPELSQHADTRSPDAFREAVEQRDHAALMQVFAPNVVFHSPIVYQEYVGRDAVALLLAAVMDIFHDFSYIDEFTASDGKLLRFRTRVGERNLEGVDILKFDTDGFVRELTVMVRPYSAATALRDAMAAKLPSLQKGPAAQ